MLSEINEVLLITEKTNEWKTKPYFLPLTLVAKNSKIEKALQHQHGRGHWVIAAQFHKS